MKNCFHSTMINSNTLSLSKLLLFCSLFLLSQSLEFTYNGFNNSNLDLDLAGATIVKPSGALRLTNKSHHVIGHAFYPDPIPMFNNGPNASSFSTHFVFQIVPSSSNRGGYGLAFTLSPSPRFPDAEDGHYLGVFNRSNDGNSANHIFMVEFDTVNGYNETSDKDGNHVGININGMNSLASKPASYYVEGTPAKEEEVHLEDDRPIQAWIEYDGLNKVIHVTVFPEGVSKPRRPLMSASIDLSPVLVKNVYAGFSAATGYDSSSHYILGWSFRLNGNADPLDLFRLPVVPVEKPSSSNVKVKRALLATFSAVLFILLVALVGILFYRRVVRFEVLEDWELDCPHRFKYKDLYKATKGFKESEKIGVGGFGAVYKGVLPAIRAEVAVKKIISNNPLQGMREFAAEIESLGRLRHKNLVNLQGWCKNKNDLLLVYDYVPNGSLDSLLYKGGFLTWEQRFNILKGVASGLLYLHEEWDQVVIHRDVKSSNVLIDRDMNAKLGDFGLARLYDHGKNSHTTNVVGTIGYIAPELTRIGKASKMTDVFAYGILLLEVACGRAPVVHEMYQNVILVDWVVECMQKGNILDAVDEKLDSMYAVEEMELVLGLGLLCSHPKAEVRPSMRQVLKYLNGDELLPLFDRLSSAGSRRVNEISSRFLALGLSGSISTTTWYQSVGTMSSSSFDSGR
ncbi:Serine/threonine protein kinase [Handroanthus impetiginosus]|uniref:non-specific serine/threonine protein kinase n=1 Tax=Handroanthus impetiginosus TaxID=429701 RepID=A0A2G9I982_9LAMI|nr:Serine/threonine protein kinase [Handroanthus impetiginosus]